MVKRESLSSLQSLRKRKKELELEMELSKRELAHSMGIMRTDLKEYVLKRIVLPVSAAGVGLYAVSKLMSGGEEPDREVIYHEEEYHHHHHHTNGAGDAMYDPAVNGYEAGDDDFDLGGFIRRWWPVAQTALGFAMGYLKKKDEVSDVRG